MQTKQIRLTPQMARTLLKNNTINRPVRPAHVEALKAALMRGEYKMTHQGIAIADDKTVLDGQHRLLAMSEMPDGFGIDILLSTDMDKETFDVIDTLTKPRNASDVLHRPSGCVAVARFVVVKLIGALRGASVTPTYLRPLVEAINPTYSDLIDYCPTVSKTWSAAAIRAAAILRILGGGDRDYVLLSYHALNHADFDSMAPIVQALYRQQVRGTVNSQSLDIFVRAFRAFDYRKQRLGTIQISDQSHLVNEARDITYTQILGQKNAATQAAAKKVNSTKSTRSANLA